MGFTCGLVGLPNAGKSTLFGALTRTKAQAGNYAFTTIEPNGGIVPVPDKRLDIISQHIKADKIVPTTMGVCRHRRTHQGSIQGRRTGQQVSRPHP